MANKYQRKIKDVHGVELNGEIDVYSVLEAFEVNNSAVAHAVKKLLCSGTREHHYKQVSRVAEARLVYIKQELALENAKELELRDLHRVNKLVKGIKFWEFLRDEAKEGMSAKTKARKRA